MAARVNSFFLLAALLPLIGASAAVAAGNGDAGKVRLALYYESLCPFSASFVVENLTRVFKDGLLEAADLTLVPYGNAEVGADRSISCQHGPDECLLNTVEACAMDAWPDLKVHFGFINCVEDLVMKRRRGEWESCFNKLGLDSKRVTDCYKSERGHELSLKFGKLTDALVPPHKYVPWVVVDGQPIGEDYENFLFYVCKAYKGQPPKVCHGSGSRRPFIKEVVKAGNGVSYNSGGVEPDRSDDDSN
ncbi:gamma-interferon-inducible lysosomal thiol reductase isoform X1 [Brachypodium distachyon]|uniref:gamma-interferon-inducible lysosomal thiol reductase isoform X1 n=1 Tax=Brachypodium distachyon TaxID=15368 RepID=UPI000234E628|nr:gamma-interferon-inducible lysosomal thiol reductase isoform X1 [Brachypodium distachyon]|eukprot:XP_003558136.1 gamma-interferon-inducible lysosomal thiol reductase isoform X1 [Brachypodium distachyon]